MAAHTPAGTRATPALVEDLGIPYREHEPLAPRTWYAVGGPADLFVEPTDAEQLAALLRRCNEREVRARVLGSGANLLVTDAGVRGVVISLTAPAFRNIHTNRTHVTAGAGVDLAKLILSTAKSGLGGLEPLAGIPASVGGAIRMNCGGRYGAIGPTVDRLTCMNLTGEMVELTRRDLSFGYRRTNLGDRIVLDARFALEPTDPVGLRERVKEIFAYKKSTQPLAEQSAGCAFKNPPPHVSDKGAGQLIDEAGLKGFAVGGAEVSRRHANFLVLHPGGTATDLIRLIRAVKQKVQEHTGVALEQEVVIWGETPLEV